jgi:ABC-type multidrug transport system fused ATPase/permease subunit
MGFIMDGLDAEEYDRKYSDSTLVKRIVGYFSTEWKRILIVAVAIVLTSLVNTIVPIVVSDGVDRLQTDRSTGTLVNITLVVIALALFGWVLNATRQWLSASTIGNIVLQLRNDAFEAVVKRDLSFYDQFPSAKIVSRVTSDTRILAGRHPDH